MTDRPHTVHVIDDEKFDRILAKRALDKSGAVERVELFATPADARRQLTEGEAPPDLIFLDINMPRMSGFEFLAENERLIKELSPTPVVVMLTTSVNPADRDRAETFDVVKEFLSKPLTVDLVHHALSLAN